MYFKCVLITQECTWPAEFLGWVGVPRGIFFIFRLNGHILAIIKSLELSELRKMKIMSENEKKAKLNLRNTKFSSFNKLLQSRAIEEFRGGIFVSDES